LIESPVRLSAFTFLFLAGELSYSGALLLKLRIKGQIVLQPSFLPRRSPFESLPYGKVMLAIFLLQEVRHSSEVGVSRNFGLLLLTTAMWLPCIAEGQKVAPDLKRDNSDQPVDVIVQYRVAPRQQHRNGVMRQGGLVKREFQFIKALHVVLPASKVAALSRDPEVAYVSPDRPLQAHLNYVTAAVNVPYAWANGLDGSGIGML
jgi:hypothetical protein